MKMTHNLAIEMAMTGNFDSAWAIAQADEGLMEGTTKAQWIEFAKKCIDARKPELADLTKKAMDYERKNPSSWFLEDSVSEALWIAAGLGWVHRCSHTQVFWTDAGVEACGK